ncbi:MAG: GDCCVxC domain-containing (seleno)protein [Methylococcales bacterium]|nr:GDCCVxC domain-containing (seleno)protein [Methylococcales bacterium]
MMILQSVITCPFCQLRQTETMPKDACVWFYLCPACRRVLKPKAGDCCVFCSYGSVPCPPKQAGPDAACANVCAGKGNH